MCILSQRLPLESCGLFSWCTSYNSQSPLQPPLHSLPSLSPPWYFLVFSFRTLSKITFCVLVQKTFMISSTYVKLVVNLENSQGCHCKRKKLWSYQGTFLCCPQAKYFWQMLWIFSALIFSFNSFAVFCLSKALLWRYSGLSKHNDKQKNK